MENNTLAKNPVDYNTPNSLAAIWSMMLPGLGQMMKRRYMAGLLWAMLVAGGYYAFFWPGIIMHGLCILDAALYKGNGSLIDLATWPKKLAFLTLVLFLLAYIIIRNSY